MNILKYIYTHNRTRLQHEDWRQTDGMEMEGIHYKDYYGITKED